MILLLGVPSPVSDLIRVVVDRMRSLFVPSASELGRSAGSGRSPLTVLSGTALSISYVMRIT
ncbi:MULTISPECIES: hypothetical protein [Nocardia]|uniref:hypothetical protein n=1 Tax=Nocardia TaxID=1817 RepID=UPI000D693AC7|nr:MULTISPECIES: hypothetical protein [Nocardia]